MHRPRGPFALSVYAAGLMMTVACGADSGSDAAQQASRSDHDAGSAVHDAAARAPEGGSGLDAGPEDGSSDAVGPAIQPGNGVDASSSTQSRSDAGTATMNACKRGVAYGGFSVADMKALSASVHWWYNWSPTPDSAVANVYRTDGVEFVPMAWGRFDQTKLQGQIPAGAQTLLGFNEPNFKTQANLSATDAAALWPALEAVADAKGLKLASPAVNYCGPASNCWDMDPISYLDHFFAACTNCRVDYIAAHWYACDGPALNSILGQLKKYDKPIWLTEFSCGDGSDTSLATQKKYMTDALAILEADPQVARYAWFSARTTAIPNVALLAGDGTLTELGQLYMSLPHADPSCAR